MTKPWMPAATTPSEPTPGAPPALPGADDARMVTLPYAELEGVVHDLRNHLNSLLMNAGVVASLAAEPARGARFIAQVERDGERCADLLQALAERHLGASPRGRAP